MREELQEKIDNLTDKELSGLLKLWGKINLPQLTTLESSALYTGALILFVFLTAIFI